jgi:hypothetical protein
LGWEDIAAYRAIFWGYGVLGFAKFVLSVVLSHAVEAEKKIVPIENSETAPLLGEGAEDVIPKKSFLRSKLPDISKESRLIMLDLCLLMGLDSFASGLVTP